MIEPEIVLVNGTMDSFGPETASALAALDLHARYLGKILPEDITCGYAYVDNDVCVSAVAAIGQCISALQDGVEADAVLAPELCRDCRSASLSELMRTALDRAGFQETAVLPFSDEDLRLAPPSQEDLDALRLAMGSTDDVVGMFGPLPVITTEAFHRTIAERLESAGLRILFPPLSYLLGNRDAFLPALEFFSDMGIHTAIGILPFGCMSGHVFARGQLRTWQKRFPAIEITLLDFDPSASDINLINRTELVIQSMRDRMEH